MINTFCKKPLWEVSRTLSAVAGGAVPAELVITRELVIIRELITRAAS